jgi:hypothetical protein
MSVIKSRITSKKDMAEVIRETIIKFNRETAWLATGVVGTVVFAAIVLAVEEHQPNAKPTESELSVHGNPNSAAGIAKNSNPNAESAASQDSTADLTIAKTSLGEKVSSSRIVSATHASGLAFKTEASHHEHRQDGMRFKGSRTENEKNRSSVALSASAVKRRLVELWHQSLAQNDKSRSWTAFSHLNKGVHKKAAYTAEMSH